MALPAMESIAPRSARATTAAAKSHFPLRMAFIYSPNGKNMEHWTPKQDGTDYELSRALAPLAKVN